MKARSIVLSLSFLCATAIVAAPVPTPESRALFESGHQAAVSGDRATARIKFDAALVADPKNFLAQFDIGGLAEDAGKKDSAIDAYEKTVLIAPDFAEAQVQLGTLYLNAKRDPDRAIERFKIALLTEKPYVDARFTLAHSRGQALRNLAVCYAVKGKFGLAQGVARSYLADSTIDHSGDAALRTLLQRSAGSLEAGMTRKFAEDLQPISKKLHAGSPSEALRAYLDFEKAHDSKTMTAADRWDLYEGIGLAQAMTNQIEEARLSFEKSAEAAIPLPYAKLQESQFNVACALASLGRGDDAIAILDELLWEDMITSVDPDRVKKKGYAPQIPTDESLTSIQKNPKLQTLMMKYNKVFP